MCQTSLLEWEDASLASNYTLIHIQRTAGVPRENAQQWLQALPSALLHHQVEDLLRQRQPKMRSLLMPWTPVAHML